MRVAIVAACLLVLPACAQKTAPLVTDAVAAPARLIAADSLVRAGCLDCLTAAFTEYSALAHVPLVRAEALEAAARTAFLIALRQNELGLLDAGSIAEAKSRAIESASTALVEMTDPAETLIAVPPLEMQSAVGETQITARARLSRNQSQWSALVEPRVPADLLATYLWIDLACGPYGTFSSPEARTAVIGTAMDAPLIDFRHTVACTLFDESTLQSFLDRDPRFREAAYYEGLAALAGRSRNGSRGFPDLDAADARFRSAYEWRQDWPTLTLAIANVALTAEDFARAFEFFDRTLALVPGHPDALMGNIRALTYLERHAEAITATDTLLETGRNPGEARYWRALNETALHQYDQAWADIELARAALVNADVPKLAGIIAINLRQLETARERLALARSRGPSDCEIGFYLQAVLSEQRRWTDVASMADTASACFDGEDARLSREIDSLRATEMTVERRNRQIARREHLRGSMLRMRAAVWFNGAVANFNLANADEARRLAEKLTDDEQFADRARALLARLVSPSP